jgi:hypothetical protein
MVKSLRLLVLLLVPIFSFSQIMGEDEVYLDGDRVEAQFNGGGMEKFQEFVNANFDNSKVSKPGKMVAAFTIDTDGSVQKIKMTQMIDPESAMEMIRVLNLCPKWKPASRGGKPISVEVKYPMVFSQKESAAVKKQRAESISAHNPSASEPLDEIPLNTGGLEFKPAYPGGMQAFYAYIAQNFSVPKSREFKGGKLIVSFVVEKDGSLTEMKVIKDIGFGTADEAFRILKASPKWIPGEQNGKKVRVYYTLPINLQSN